MEAAAIPPSMFPSPTRPLPSLGTPTRTTNTAPPHQIVRHQSSPSIDCKEQGDQAGGLVRVKMEAASDVLRSRSSSKKKRKKESGDARVERKTTSEIHVEQRDGSEIPISETVGAKRPLCHASENSRARKDAKTNAKVVVTQLQDSKTAGRKMSPIVSRSLVINMFARKKAHSYARSPNLHARSPNSHTRSPNPSGTLKSPSLHDLSPGPAHGIPTTFHGPSAAATNGSKCRPRKLISIVWNDAKPIYIDGFLMQGRCKYCNIVLPASKVSGTSQLARHMKVCEVKCSMDGVIQQIKTSGEIDPDWKIDQTSARIELVKLIVLHGLPFSFVKYAGFRKFCASLNPWFKSVNRNTIQKDCMDAYYQHRDIYESSFQNCDHRVSLTGDMWSSNQKFGYLCITCNWIDSEWRIRHRIIRFCLVETPHDAWNMFGVILKSLSDWNIEDIIFSFTMDNAEVNTKMLSHLRKIL